MKNRFFSFIIPFFFDGAYSLLTAVIPILAINMGADSLFLGAMGVIGQTIRFPICLISGRLSERVGRIAISIPAAIILIITCIMLTKATNKSHVLILFVFSAISLALFYPPFQALIGEVSEKGQLTKNLGAYSMGWCVGATITAVAAGWLVDISMNLAFYVAAALAFLACTLVGYWGWHQTISKNNAEKIIIQTVSKDHPKLLIVSRLGMFLGFFSYAVIRILYPKLGIWLGWKESEIAKVISALMVGQGLGIIIANMSPWWKEKWWPQITAISLMMVSMLIVGLTVNKLILIISLIICGFSLSICYTSSLYLGISARKNIGKNTGIHESLVALGVNMGCLLGGAGAQYISLQTPYFLASGLAFFIIIFSIYLFYKPANLG